jgi:hypothetical protein
MSRLEPMVEKGAATRRRGLDATGNDRQLPGELPAAHRLAGSATTSGFRSKSGAPK